MTDTDRCHGCGRSLALVAADAIETARESIGFGAANDRTRWFCSTRCRCLWAGVDPVLDATTQATLTAYDAAHDGPDRDAPETITWSC